MARFNQWQTIKYRFDAMYVPEPNSGCWLWVGSLNRGGYAQIRNNYTQKMAHRFAYEMFVGPIPKDMQLDHLCRVRCCVNPRHLEPVSARENKKRGEQGDMKKYCGSGHLWTAENIYISGGKKYCRICRKERWLKCPARLRRMQ